VGEVLECHGRYAARSTGSAVIRAIVELDVLAGVPLVSRLTGPRERAFGHQEQQRREHDDGEQTISMSPNCQAL